MTIQFKGVHARNLALAIGKTFFPRLNFKEIDTHLVGYRYKIEADSETEAAYFVCCLERLNKDIGFETSKIYFEVLPVSEQS